MPNSGYLIGVDVGGTFTDVVLASERGELVCCLKVPSSPEAADAVIEGILLALNEAGLPPAAITRLLHGTTVGTNAILEKKGAKVGLLTTEGFRDVLEIGRQTRPEIYNLFTRRPEPLVPRRFRREIAERMRADGNVQRSIDPAQVRQEAQALLADNVESIAICLLFSFLHPEHEQIVRDIVRELQPDLPVSVSSALIPVFKEYERTSTTVLNAYILPVVSRYLLQLAQAAKAAGIAASVEVMQSNGGTMSALSAAERPVHLVLSGPAGGVVASNALGQSCLRKDGGPNLISIDIGGTSTDVCLLQGGSIPLNTDGEIGGYPVSVPMVPIHTVGAGGGSIAWVDSGGAVRVGPQSAGAVPGPACYGRGGKNATVTDAALVLGRLNPRAFAGNIVLDLPAAQETIAANVSSRLGITVEAAAERMVQVAVANVVRAIRLVSVEKGHDPRDFALLAFGGAGPLLAAEVSEALEISMVIVPPHPGNFSALGLLLTPIKHEATRSVLARLEGLSAADLAALVHELETRAMEMLRHDAESTGDAKLERIASLRYLGQSYEIDMHLGEEKRPEAISARFHEMHQSRYGFQVAGNPVELVHLRVTASAGRAHMELSPLSNAEGAEAAHYATREVYHDGRLDSWPVFRRERLSAGVRLTGPAIVEESGSTTIILDGTRVDVDPWGNVVIEGIDRRIR